MGRVKTFYEYQEAARSRSAALLLMMGLAISVTTLATGLALTIWLFIPTFYLVYYFVPSPVGDHVVEYPDWVPELLLERFPEFQHFPWELCAFFFAVLTVASGAAIVIATRNKVRQLWEAGGVGLADSLGGVCVSAEDYRRDDRTQRAVNVVNEVAVAARLPQPHVYLLHQEQGINAFAVGLTSRDMVVGLTAGAIAKLNREQLQGVVGHEFAHIQHGDTARNVLLVGYLHGLMTLIIAAQSLIQNGIQMMVRSISHGGQGLFGMFVTACGALLFPVGLIGMFSATLVKAAYSRQREFLADAQGLQLVRNDRGMADAMKRIMSDTAGSRVLSPQCLSLSHVFFAKSVTGILGWFDSHPPLEKRILRLDRSWDGQPVYEDEHEIGEFQGVLKGQVSVQQKARDSECGRFDAVATMTDGVALLVTDELAMGVGRYAGEVRDKIPAALWQLTQELPTAEAMIFALWSAGTTKDAHDDVNLEPLHTTSPAAKQVADALFPHIESFGLPQRLMLFDAALNHIRKCSQQDDMSDFCNKAQTLLAVPCDGDLFRWSWKKSLEQLVFRELGNRRPQPQYGECLELLDECQVLISALAQANESDVMRAYALQRASNVIGQDFRLLPEQDCDLEALDRALENLSLLAPKARQQLVRASSTSLETDARLNEAESLLMRGICSGLGYPPVTFLPGQPV